jgi:hypothetical protein
VPLPGASKIVVIAEVSDQIPASKIIALAVALF